MNRAVDYAHEASKIVLQTSSVYVRTGGDPFFFSSGWASPVFIDIKRLISFPDSRTRLIELALARIDQEFTPGTYQQIAGGEPAGAPFAAIIADRRNLPLVVAMRQSRGFGRFAQLEGRFEPGTRTLLFDDLTTDGHSKAMFKRALEAAQAKVIGIFVLLDYGIFPEKPDIKSLMSLSDIVSVAEEENFLDKRSLDAIRAFAANAPMWSKRNGGIGGIS